MALIYPFASPAKVSEALGVIGAERIGEQEVTLYKQILVGVSSTGELTPPSKAPVLSVGADLGSFVANLAWTASNKTSSDGFGYRVYVQVDGGGYNPVAPTTTNLFLDYDAGSTPGSYDFRVFPFNAAGEGVGSNVASVVLPGESESQFLLLEDGTEALLENDTEILLEAA